MKKWTRQMVMGLTAVVVLTGTQRLLAPKYMGRVIEGAFIAEYYQETTPHDVLILGDCEVYENISPVELWEQYGITSYIRGSANQLPAQSYYLLEDTLRYETPRAVVWNVAAMSLGVQEKEAYNRMTMEGMRWSSSKWRAIRETAMEDEYMIEYVLPILRYHSRWSELEKEDFVYYFNKKTVSHNGYYMRCDSRPPDGFPTPRRRSNYEFPQSSWSYLDKMEELCRKKGIQLILIKAPSLYPVWPEEYESQIQAYASSKDLQYLNFLEEPTGLDYRKDTYDGGLHLNLYGAEKLTRCLGQKLAEAGLSDHRDEDGLRYIWQKKVEFYHQQQELQEQELETWGYLKQFAEEGEI